MNTASGEYRFFTEKTAKVFAAVAACIVPASGGSKGAAAASSLALADRALADRPEQDRRLLALFLGAVERLPILRYGRPFSRLSQAQQVAVLSFLESTRLLPKLRQGFFGVKAFVLLGYYANPENFGAIGYPGPRLDAPYYQLRARAQAPQDP